MEGSGGAGARGRAVIIKFLTLYMHASACQPHVATAGVGWRTLLEVKRRRRGQTGLVQGAERFYRISDSVRASACQPQAITVDEGWRTLLEEGKGRWRGQPGLVQGAKRCSFCF